MTQAEWALMRDMVARGLTRPQMLAELAAAGTPMSMSGLRGRLARMKAKVPDDRPPVAFDMKLAKIMFDRGEGLNAIARAVGARHDYVQAHLARTGRVSSKAGLGLTVDLGMLRALGARGLSATEIAKRMGLRPNTVASVAWRYGITLRGRKGLRPKIDPDRVRALAARGMTRLEIAQTLTAESRRAKPISKNTVGAIAWRHGIELKSTGGRPASPPQAPLEADREEKDAAPARAAPEGQSARARKPRPSAVAEMKADVSSRLLDDAEAIRATQGRTSELLRYAAKRDMTITQALQRWHAVRAQRGAGRGA